MSKFRRICFDLETDGLLSELTKIHCISLRDLDSIFEDEYLLFHDDETITPRDGSIADGLEVIRNAELVVAHNLIGFDREALAKVTGYRIPLERCFDTLVASRLAFSDLRDKDFSRRDKDPEFPGKYIGSHALGAWGYRLGEAKGEFGGKDTDWSTWTQEMADYAVQDVVVNVKLYDFLKDKLPQNDLGMTPFEIETEFADAIEEMNRAGISINREAMTALVETLEGRLTDLESEIQELFPPEFHPYKPYPSGKPRLMPCKERGGKHPDKMVRFMPSSRQQLARRLEAKYGWSPVRLSQKGNPVLDEEVLLELADRYPEVRPVMEYHVVSSRLATIRDGASAYMKLMDDEGIIRGRVIHIGTQTGRCAHRSPNLGNIRSRGPYGKDIRALFVPRKGHKMLGFDASALEFCALAHYVGRWDGGELTRAVVEGDKADGTDVHSVNRDNIRAAGVDCDRAMAKTAVYCTMYGGSARRLAEQLGCSTKDARKIQKALTGGIKGLRELQAQLSTAVREYGSLRSILGMRVGVRSEHSALNFLLQSCGAGVMKLVTIFFRRACIDAGLRWGEDVIMVAHVHDEAQLSIVPEAEDEVRKAVARAFAQTNDFLNLRCPVSGEAEVGDNWSQTH